MVRHLQSPSCAGGPQAEHAANLGLLGHSDAILRVADQIHLVADKQASVLITGETGVGKERVARALHGLSLRRTGDLVTVNCAGIPATLLDDEFFGHERGAFTDAHQSRPGRFEQADGGTIFLDEIGDLPVMLQPKLLRVLQEREICRLGGIASIPVDCRVISATNVSLTEAVSEGRFRQDLFYRLNVFPIYVPPLRERREDIPVFVANFLERYCRYEGLPQKILDGRAAAELMTRPWPGNIRELENAVETAAIRSQDRELVTIADFATHDAYASTAMSFATRPDSPVNLCAAILRFEGDLIRHALQQSAGNKTQAARILGVKRTTLIEKLRRISLKSLDSGRASSTQNSTHAQLST